MNKLAGKRTSTTQLAMLLHSLSAFNVGHCAVTRGSNHFLRGCAWLVWQRLAATPPVRRWLGGEAASVVKISVTRKFPVDLRPPPL